MALGDLVSVIDTQDFALYSGEPLVLCKRNKNIVVLLSQNLTTNPPLARAIEINDAGSIDGTPKGSLELFDTAGRDLGLIHWHDDVFIAIQDDQYAECRLISFAVSDAGVIPGSIIDELRLRNSSNYAHKSHLSQIHDTVIVTGECLPGGTRHLETALVSEAGSFAAGLADSMEVSTQPMEQRFRQGSGNMMVGVFTDSFIPYIFTFSVTASGSMPATPPHEWASFTSGSERVSLCKVTDLVYAILTFDDDNKIRIRTFSINVDGSINESFIDDEEVDSSPGGSFYMTEMWHGYFILAYKVTGIPGRIKTYTISDAGVISSGHVSSRDIATTDFSEVSILHLQGDIWAMAFGNTASQILIYSLEIETPGDAVPHHEMIMKIGP